MNKQEIIEALNNAIQPDETYYLNENLIQEINNYPNPAEFVEPILELIEKNPTVDFGMPGELVHFVETFSNKGYEELLIKSVKQSPTPHNIWMLHRCYNDRNDTRHETYKTIVKELKSSNTTPEDVKVRIDLYDWE